MTHKALLLQPSGLERVGQAQFLGTTGNLVRPMQGGATDVGSLVQPRGRRVGSALGSRQQPGLFAPLTMGVLT